MKVCDYKSSEADKRWFGRYAWVQFTKVNNNFLSFNKKVY